MAEETQYTANTGLVTISTANANLDGTGMLVTVLTAASNGTLIKTITIKANNSVTQGMVRLFIYDGTNNRLFREVEIPAVVRSTINPSFETRIDLDFALKPGYVLKAAPQNSEAFVVIAEGLDWAYYASSVRTDTTQYTANTGVATITTASFSVTLLTAGANGCSVESITVKALGDTTEGTVGIFIYDGDEYILAFTEMKVPAITRSAIAHSYEYNLVFENDFDLKAGCSLVAVTRQTQSFRVTAEGLDWAYPA